MRDVFLPNVSWRPPLASSGACAALDLSPVGWAPPRDAAANFLAFLSNRTVVFAGDSVLGELYVALVRKLEVEAKSAAVRVDHFRVRWSLVTEHCLRLHGCKLYRQLTKQDASSVIPRRSPRVMRISWPCGRPPGYLTYTSDLATLNTRHSALPTAAGVVHHLHDMGILMPELPSHELGQPRDATVLFGLGVHFLVDEERQLLGKLRDGLLGVRRAGGPRLAFFATLPQHFAELPHGFYPGRSKVHAPCVVSLPEPTPYAAQERELLGGLHPIFDASDLLLGAGAAHSGRHLPTGDCTHWVGCDLFNGSATNGSLDCPQFGCAAAPDFGVLARYVAPSLMAFLSDG